MTSLNKVRDKPRFDNARMILCKTKQKSEVRNVSWFDMRIVRKTEVKSGMKVSS